MLKELITEALVGDATRAQRIVIWRTTILALFTAHMFWAAGVWLPGAEAGFVTNEKFRTLQEDVEAIRKNQVMFRVDHIVAGIESAQERMCKALRDDNADALSYARALRNEHVRQYEELTGKSAILPTCKELGYE